MTFAFMLWIEIHIGLTTQTTTVTSTIPAAESDSLKKAFHIKIAVLHILWFFSVGIFAQTCFTAQVIPALVC